MCESLCDRTIVTTFFVNGIGLVHNMSTTCTCTLEQCVFLLINDLGSYSIEYVKSSKCAFEQFVIIKFVVRGVASIAHTFKQFKIIACSLYRLLWCTGTDFMVVHYTIDHIIAVHYGYMLNTV